MFPLNALLIIIAPYLLFLAFFLYLSFVSSFILFSSSCLVFFSLFIYVFCLFPPSHPLFVAQLEGWPGSVCPHPQTQTWPHWLLQTEKGALSFLPFFLVVIWSVLHWVINSLLKTVHYSLIFYFSTVSACRWKYCVLTVNLCKPNVVNLMLQYQNHF